MRATKQARSRANRPSARRSGGSHRRFETARRRLTADLEAIFDAPTLARLLTEGETLDEEALCALTLETVNRT